MERNNTQLQQLQKVNMVTYIMKTTQNCKIVQYNMKIDDCQRQKIVIKHLAMVLKEKHQLI